MLDKITIIGAGIGGLSVAIRLAAAGHPVTIYEKNPAVGGKMEEFRADGFRWDTGPSVITMRSVLTDLFAATRRRLEDYLDLTSVEPLTRYFYSDGTILNITRDLPHLLDQIAAIDERDVEGYLSFLAYAASLHRITGPVFIYDQTPTLRSFARVSLPDMLRVDAWRSMDAAIRQFVRSPHLRQLLGRFATYVGASPYHAPATLNVIAHVELNGGVWYPRGGIYSIARALEKLARELGVQIHTNCEVQQIQIKNSCVSGLLLANGRQMEANSIIANVDVATVYEKLLPSNTTNPHRLKSLLRADLSCSGFILLLGVEGQRANLAHHNIFFSSDYRREFDDLFNRHMPPDEPTIYLAITSKTDPGDAPEGCENWFVLVNVPALDEQMDWSAYKSRYRDQILARLKTFGLDVTEHIRSERILTPVDVERMTGARRGALYGLSSNSPFTAFRRPHNRATDVKNLYFVGGTTHPGGGVPMVMLSGKIVAGMIAGVSA